MASGVSLSRAQLMQAAVAAAIRHGVNPQIFLRQINQESGFNPGAHSGAGAEGIAQFMPGTAAGYHIDPWNPLQALDAAARYDASELRAFGGDYRRALAAYNAGAGNADQWDNPNFAGGQTYNYVRDILGGSPLPVPKGGGTGVQPSPSPGNAPKRGAQNVWSLGATRVPTPSGSMRKQAVTVGQTVQPPTPQIDPAALANLTRIASQLSGLFRPQPYTPSTPPVLQPLPNVPAGQPPVVKPF